MNDESYMLSILIGLLEKKKILTGKDVKIIHEGNINDTL